ncbi:formyltransferase family protein [Lentzea sp. NPDC004789]
MRVVVAGKGWLAVRGARLLAALIAVSGRDAVVEVVRNRSESGRDTWLPSLVALAERRGWPVHDRLEKAELGPGDMFLSLQHDRVVDCAALGGAAAYNLHFAALPRYRGSLAAALPVRHGETAVGVTLHVLVQKVDAGPIIARRTFPLPVFSSAYDLYRAYHDHGFELFKEHAAALLDGAVQAEPQDEALATVFSRKAIDFSDSELTDLDRDVDEVRDWCRSLIFPPEQYPTYRGRLIASCFSLRWGRDGVGGYSPGTVVHEDPDQVILSCRSGELGLEFVPLSS